MTVQPASAISPFMSLRALRTVATPFIAIALCALSTAGCRNAFRTSEHGLLEQLTPEAQLSSHQLRVLVNDFTLRFNSRIEEGADRILAQTYDTEIRRNAILWKKNATGSALRAASRTDSLAAYLDLWILNRQMTALFSASEGSRLFGPCQPIAVETCRRLEPDLRGIYSAIGSDLPLGEDFVAQFAADYPVRNLYFDRESLSSRYVQAVGEPTRELYQVVGRLQENLAEMQKLSIIYAEHLPKQSRWEAELLLLDAPAIETIRQPLTQLSMLTDSALQLTPMMTSLPQIVQHEREAMQQFVTQQRLETMAQVDHMREATIGDMQQERIAVLQTVQAERAAVSRQIDDGLTRAFVAADDISRRRTEEIADRGKGLIDHAIARLETLLGLLALIVFAVLLYQRWYRNSPSPGREDDWRTIPVELDNAVAPPSHRRAA